MARRRAASRYQPMATGVGITDAIKSLSDLQVRCNLHQADNEGFFSEWVENLPNNELFIIDFIVRKLD